MSGCRTRSTEFNDRVQLEELAEIEKSEGRKSHYYTLALMIEAKALVHAEGEGEDKAFDIARVTPVLERYEASIKALEAYSDSHPEEKAAHFSVGRPVFPENREGTHAPRARQNTLQRGGADELAIRLRHGWWRGLRLPSSITITSWLSASIRAQTSNGAVARRPGRCVPRAVRPAFKSNGRSANPRAKRHSQPRQA